MSSTFGKTENPSETATIEDRKIQMSHTPDPKRAICEQIVNMLKSITNVEHGMDNLNIGDSDYHTVMPAVEKAKAALANLNTVYQARVYRRPQNDRNIPVGVQVQTSKRRLK